MLPSERLQGDGRKNRSVDESANIWEGSIQRPRPRGYFEREASLFRRTAIVATSVALLLVLSASSALAHFCFNASRSDRGNQAAAGSPAWGSIAEFLRGDLGLCEAGIDHVLDGVEAAGFPRNLLIHNRTVLAQGRLGKHQHLSVNRKGIDHLSGQDFVLFERLIGQAFGICG